MEVPPDINPNPPVQERKIFKIKFSGHPEIILNNTNGVNKFTIGRALTCDHILTNCNVSRIHCVLEFKDDTYYISDKSTNGILINGTLLKGKTVLLRHNDVVHFNNETSFQYFIEECPSVDEILEMYNEVMDDFQTSFPVPNEPAAAEPSTADESVIFVGSETVAPAVINLVSPPNMPKKNETASTTNVPTLNRIKLNPLVRLSKIKKPDTSVTGQDGASSKSTGGDKRKSHESSPEPSTSEKKRTCSTTDFEEDLTCSICTELFIKPVTINCSHSFCEHCLGMWTKSNKLCPICRSKITTTSPSIILENLVSRIVLSLSISERDSRERIAQERLESAAQPKPSKKGKKPLRTRASARTRRARMEPLIEISSDDNDSTDGATDVDDYMDFLQMDDFNDGEYSNYNGIRGNYYGGYGICFKCHMPGHWANGCPNR